MPDSLASQKEVRRSDEQLAAAIGTDAETIAPVFAEMRNQERSEQIARAARIAWCRRKELDAHRDGRPA